jgi:general secretion pathway protein H
MPRRSSIRGLRRSAGFTLLEILAVLALIGLISALLIGNSTALLKAFSSDDVESTALSAIASARHSAVLTGRVLELRGDEQNRLLDWQTGTAALAGPGDVHFLPAVMTSAMLVGGSAVEAPIARVRFYPDGTCDPFRLEIVREGVNRILTIDPWTCTALATGPARDPH